MPRRVLEKPRVLQESAESHWEFYTRTYDFEDVEAFTLATLCNMRTYAEKCADMCFDSSGRPIPRIPKRMISGIAGDEGTVPNPFIDDLSKANREIEKLTAALGIQVSAKVPVKPSVESPVDRAARKKAEKESK